MHDQPNVKLCECGCGQATPIAAKTDARRRARKGDPTRFVVGHATRGRPRLAEERESIRTALRGKRFSPEHIRNISLAHGGTGEPGSRAIHERLEREHPKTGVCEECKREAATEFAFKRHPEPHTPLRSDYRELCRSCHQRFDSWLRRPR